MTTEESLVDTGETADHQDSLALNASGVGGGLPCLSLTGGSCGGRAPSRFVAPLGLVGSGGCGGPGGGCTLPVVHIVY